MFFQIQALGNVERDPELHITQDGSPVTEFTLAVNTKRCVEDITIWLNCYAWGGLAETVERYVTKGSMIFVQGDFTPYYYTTEEGKQELNLEVNVEKFSFAGGRKPQENGQKSGQVLMRPTVRTENHTASYTPLAGLAIARGFPLLQCALCAGQ